MQNRFSASLPHAVPVLLRLTERRAYWRVAVITPGRIRWRTYSREAYPEADAVLERCLAGLFPQQKRQHHGEGHADEGGRPDVHSAPLFLRGGPEARDEQDEQHHGLEDIQENQRPDGPAEKGEAVRHPAPPAVRVQVPPRLRVAWWGWL